MQTVTSRQLKNRTGAIIARVRKGERIVVTNHGREVALIVPVSDKPLLMREHLRPFEEAWQDITATLGRARPPHKNWKDALKQSRRRR